MKSVQVFSLALLFVLIVCLPAFAAGTTVTPPSPETSIPLQAEQNAKLLTAIHRTGSLRVIVGLDVPFQPEGSLPGLTAVQQQHTAIVQAQTSLLNRLSSYNLTLVHRFSYIPYIVVNVEDEPALQTLMADQEVSTIHEDTLLTLSLSESAPLIGAPTAWDYGYTGAGWSIAIIDSGVESSHPFLAGKVVEEACYSTASYTGFPDGTFTTLCPNGRDEQTGSGAGQPCSLSSCDHGTHVAGIAAGKSSNMSGIAKDATIIAIQVQTQLNDASLCRQLGYTSTPCSTILNSDIVRALERVYELRTKHAIASVNLSLGGKTYSSQTLCDWESAAQKSAIDNLRSVGIVTIAASGNGGETSGLSSPGCISTVISVGSTGDGSQGSTVDKVSSFSNAATFLDLLAPGEWIFSSVTNGGYDWKKGTSMAAPHVAGAWAVMKSKAPDASIDDMFNGLRTTGKAITDYRDSRITVPRIQLDAALDTLPENLKAPTNLIATLEGKRSIQLSWMDNNRTEDGHIILRWSGSEWQQIGQVGANITSYTDSKNITCNKEYFYRIYAYKGNDVSDYSNAVSITTEECASPGDCNEDDTVDAGDLSAIVLEISSNTFDSTGCDANQDNQVDKQDITCTVQRLFGRSCTATPAIVSLSSSMATTSAILSSSGADEETPSPQEFATDHPVFDVTKNRTRNNNVHLSNTLTPTNPLTSTMPVTLTDVAIVGETWGATMTDYTFTAIVSPTNATRPITYTWHPAPAAGQGQEQAMYTWNLPGRQTVQVTATSTTRSVSATHTITITPDLYAIAPVSATITGVPDGYTSLVYTFTAAVSPTGLTRPISYTWTPEPLAGQGTITSTYRWQAPGNQTIGFTATNRAGHISTTHTITVARLIEQVTIEGESTGFVGQEYAYNAVISPTIALSSTVPIRYTWHPAPLSGQGERLVAYRWTSPGLQTIGVTATTAYESAAVTKTITVYDELKSVTIAGATSGATYTEYTFTAITEPDMTDEPVTYAWSPQPDMGQGTRYATYRWTSAGQRSIQVVVQNPAGVVTDEHAITIAPRPDGPALTIPNWKPAAANSEVQIPITFIADGTSTSSVAFSIDYDQEYLLFNPYDSSAVQFADLGSGIEGSVTFDVRDSDGEIDIVVTDTTAPLTGFPDDDVLVTLTFSVRNTTNDGQLAAMNLSTTPATSFGDTKGASIAGSTTNGSIRINADTRPVVGLPPYVESPGIANIPVTFAANGTETSKVRFWLDYDESLLSLDTRDSDGNGVPDAISFANGITGQASVTPGNLDKEIMIEVSEVQVLPGAASLVGGAVQALSDGQLATIALTVKNPTASPSRMGVRFSPTSPPQFSDAAGQSVAGTINGGTDAGTIIIASTTEVYLPFINR